MAPKRLDRDSQLAIELDYCCPRGIPHSEFLGWSTSDRDKAIWWLLRERETCPSCGTRPEEWLESKGGHRHAYIGQVHECEGCIVRARTEEAPEMKQGRPEARRVVLVRNPEVR